MVDVGVHSSRLKTREDDAKFNDDDNQTRRQTWARQVLEASNEEATMHKLSHADEESEKQSAKEETKLERVKHGGNARGSIVRSW